MTTFALVGRNIGYSFSQKYFTEKFKREGINDCEYIYFDIQNLNELPALLKSTSNLRGMNVTLMDSSVIIPTTMALVNHYLPYCNHSILTLLS